MPVSDWRIDRSGLKEKLTISTRLRAPYRNLRAIFSDEGDTRDTDGGKVTTGWLLRRKTGGLAFVHDRQLEENRKFNLESFRARPHHDWYVDAKDDATLKEFCGWLSKEIIRRVEAEPQPKRLTQTAKEKVNDAIAKGMNVQDAMKAHAEWELIAPAAEAFMWPMKDPPKDIPFVVKVPKGAAKALAEPGEPTLGEEEEDLEDAEEEADEEAEAEPEADAEAVAEPEADTEAPAEAKPAPKKKKK